MTTTCSFCNITSEQAEADGGGVVEHELNGAHVNTCSDCFLEQCVPVYLAEGAPYWAAYGWHSEEAANADGVSSIEEAEEFFGVGDYDD